MRIITTKSAKKGGKPRSHLVLNRSEFRRIVAHVRKYAADWWDEQPKLPEEPDELDIQDANPLSPDEELEEDYSFLDTEEPQGRTRSDDYVDRLIRLQEILDGDEVVDDRGLAGDIAEALKTRVENVLGKMIPEGAADTIRRFLIERLRQSKKSFASRQR